MTTGPQGPWQSPQQPPQQPPRPPQGYPGQGFPGPQGYPQQGPPPQGYPQQGPPPQGYPQGPGGPQQQPGGARAGARPAGGGLRERLSPRKDRLARDALGDLPPAGPPDAEALLDALPYHVSVPVERHARRQGPVLGLLVRRLRRRFAAAVLAEVRLRRWTTDPRTAEVAANWERINRETRGGTAAVALLGPWIAAVVAVVVAVADYAYFAGLLADLADLEEGDYLSSAAVTARALALTTPLLVLAVCAPAGALTAAWLCGARPSRRLLGLGVALVLATLGVSALFASFARFRFQAEASGLGAAEAPTLLLALLLGSLPLLAAVVGGLLEAPPCREYRTGRRAHRGVLREGRRAERAGLRTRRRLADAHGRLRSRVAGLLSRHLDVPAQIAEHAVLTTRAREGMDRRELRGDVDVPGWWSEPGRPVPLRGAAVPIPPPALRRLGEVVDALAEHAPDRLEAAADAAWARSRVPLPAPAAAPAQRAPERVVDLRGQEPGAANGASGAGAAGEAR